VTPDEVLAALQEHGALMKGHFVLSSGRHAATFVEKFRVLEHPRLTQKFGAAIAEAFDNGFDVVASPAVGAIVLGFSAALAADRRFVFTERSSDHMMLRRGFLINEGERVLVVEDVVTTGGSAREVVDLVAAAGGVVVGVGVLIDRADPQRSDLGVPLKSLARVEVGSWDPSDCPMCRKGEPVTDPGSRRLQG
jgi:orotate phosphoribosyltransferase